MRLDLYISEKGLARSRTEAKNLIESGAVSVSGKTVTKPSYPVEDGEEVFVEQEKSKYVSRGGYKLEGALDAFSIDVKDRLCLDIGASSGGFTDCLLSRGARAVTAVDSGRDQIAEKLRQNSRVSVIESYNARYMKREDFSYIPTLVVMDVSFISATYIIEPLSECVEVGCDFVCLIKPQFEVGRSNIGKGGIVKDRAARKMACDKVIAFAASRGFSLLGLIESPILGGDGNTEYLAHFKKEGIS